MFFPTNSGEELKNELAPHWKTPLVLGTVMALIGLFALLFPYISSVTTIYFVSAVLLAAGLVHFFHIFSGGGMRGRLMEGLFSLLYLAVGAVIIFNPLLGMQTLTAMIIGLFLADGAIKILYAFKTGSLRTGGIFFSGIVSVILAVLLWSGWPATGLWALGMLLGVHFFVSGLGLVLLAFEVRREVKEEGEHWHQPPLEQG